MKKTIGRFRHFLHAMFTDKEILPGKRERQEEHILAVVMTLVMIAGVLFGSKQIAGIAASSVPAAADMQEKTVCGRQNAPDVTSTTGKEEMGDYIVVLDAGHGGCDGGKVNADGVVESELNLAITLKLRDALEAKGVKVVLTRDSGEGLYREGDRNLKASDMKRRVEIMDNSGADLAISIHQNSFTDSRAHGAQVFYYEGSEEGKRIAEAIQKDLVTYVEPENQRLAKGNKTYYLLKKTKIRTVIVECGFLSNPDDAAKLVTEEYQDLIAGQLAESICRILPELGK